MKRLSLGVRFALTVVPVAGIAVGFAAYMAWVALTGIDPVAEMSSDQLVILTIVIVVLIAIAVTSSIMLARSVLKRVDRVSKAAQHVVESDISRLIDVLKAPGSDSHHSSTFVPLPEDTEDPLGDLGVAMNAMHEGLVDATQQQMAILSKGVSEIFVTLARRNSSLVHRQLSLLDELEANEEDPEVLGGYYQMDHLAARMKRNSESLLVLAGSEPPRTRTESTDIIDVIRAAVGEVDDFQRVEVLACEPARLVGNAVSDMAHLLSELLDNATQFSPPSAMVRVAGLFDPNGYMLTITDSGIGMSNARITELNAVLQRPPVLGLSLEPTLGIYVVARLASRHGINVHLTPGVPGMNVRIHIPSRLLDLTPVEVEHGSGDEAEEMPVEEQVFSEPTPETSSDTPSLNGSHGEEPQHNLPILKPVVADLGEDIDSPVDVPVLKPVFQEPEPEDAADRFRRPKPIGISDGKSEEPEISGDEGPHPLPVRTPGVSYQGEEPAGAATNKSDGAIGIRSALGKFEKGRKDAKNYESEPDEGSDRS